jgi:hypothetical protein
MLSRAPRTGAISPGFKLTNAPFFITAMVFKTPAHLFCLMPADFKETPAGFRGVRKPFSPVSSLYRIAPLIDGIASLTDKTVSLTY